MGNLTTAKLAAFLKVLNLFSLQHPSGTWLGECEGRVGRFKFINVVEVEGLVGENRTGEEEEEVGELDASSVPELLASLGLHQLTRLEWWS